MSNLYLLNNLGQPNNLTIETCTRLLKIRNYVLILSIFSHIENMQFALYERLLLRLVGEGLTLFLSMDLRYYSTFS